MALMIMQRDFVIKSLGHSIGFTAGVAQWVPPECHSEAMKYGAVAVDQNEDLKLEKAPERPKVITGQDRDEALHAAMVYLRSNNNTDDFGANGLPKIGAVKSIVGFDVSGAERDAAWTKMKKVQIAEDRPATNDI
jgi:hypothetical protein